MSRTGGRPTSSGAQTAPHRGRQDEHLVERHRHRARVAEDGHGRGVSDQHQVHAGLLGDLGARVVVGGDHRDRLAQGLLFGELGQGHGAPLAGGAGLM